MLNIIRDVPRTVRAPNGWLPGGKSLGRGAKSPKSSLSSFANGGRPLDSDNHAQGRPVGVAVDNRGALLVADDVGNVVWRVSRAGNERQTAAR
jgi:hypothetical protein